jgi:hypothetical protein
VGGDFPIQMLGCAPHVTERSEPDPPAASVRASWHFDAAATTASFGQAFGAASTAAAFAEGPAFGWCVFGAAARARPLCPSAAASARVAR